MFNVTLVNLSADAREAVDSGGNIDLGALRTEELTGLLRVFTELDALENTKVDPEIRVQSRRDRFIIRTGQGKLFLQDARKMSEPAYVLTVNEVIAELDGSAAARRTAPPVPLPSTPDGTPAGDGTTAGTTLTPLPEIAPRPWPLALIGVVAVLGSLVAYTLYSGRENGGRTQLAELTTTERLAEDSALTGVYTTGTEPGHHGIILLGDGKLKLFQLNARAAPGVVFGTYQLGGLDAKICLATDQPGGLIKVISHESLEFCGEIYRRVP